MRFTKEIYDRMDRYCELYAKRILEADDPSEMMSEFDFGIASEKIGEMIGKGFGFEDQEAVKNKVFEYAKNRIPAYFLVLRRKDMPVELAEVFIRDKGSRFFKEFKDVRSSVIPEQGIKPNNYRVTRAQLGYIERLGYSVIHEDELTGREASEIIRCAKCATRTKPSYFTYFAKADIGKED